MHPDLIRSFNSLQQSCPHLVSHAVPLAMGTWGLAVDRDGDIAKFLFRQSSPRNQKQAQVNLDNEVTFMRLMQGRPLGRVKTPTLTGDIIPLEDQQFFATYSMTKIPGCTSKWWGGIHPDEKPRLPENEDLYFHEAGETLARFHAQASMLPSGGLIRHNSEQGGKISQIPFMSSDTNDILAGADSYLQCHKKASVIHGDFHGGNILLDEESRITGLVDFAATGPSENFLADFMNIPPRNLPFFIKGYERESGQTIDPVMITLTKIGFITSFINGTTQPEEHQEYIRDLRKELRTAESLGGFVLSK